MEGEDRTNRAQGGSHIVVANNHFEAKGAVNALQLRNMLTGQRVSAPEPLLQHYPDLKQIADPIEDENPSLPLRA